MKAFSELTSASYVSNSDILAISQENSGTYSSKKTTVKEVSDFANQNFAEEYDSTSSYAVGDYVIYESVLYKCIGTTTGTFDSTKWTSVVVTNEMGSGGGGGTGGHTIIDENGNSMTARAGLQFVGGANVSDDATNNKTIVDLAIAGGIDGVFIDTDNVIIANAEYTSDQAIPSYTATEDCFVRIYILGKSGQTTVVSINSESIANCYFSSNDGSQDVFLFMKKGQILSITSGGYWNINYKVLGIQTGTTHSKFQPVIYSLEEREIGVWTDGKPLYEKTLVIPSLSAGENTIQHNIANFDKMIFCQGRINYDGDDLVVPYMQTQIASGNVAYGIGISNFNSTRYFIILGNMFNVSKFSGGYVTVRYTKTTDVAGSGTWTPQGVPTHHYSTDEQIIGTWNGETFYEKTYFNVSLTNGANNLVESNFDSHRVLQKFSVSTKGMANTLFNYNSSVSDTLFVENGDLKYYISKTGSWWSALDKVDITIQYTKSS